jgi:uncharacterized protein (DUF433 family)
MSYDFISEMVDESLDCGGDVVIRGIRFSRSQILKELDPIAYRELIVDFADAEIENLQDDLDCLDPETDADEIEDIRSRIAELEGV